MAKTPKYLLQPITSLEEIKSFHFKSAHPDERLAGLEEEIFIHASKQGLPLAGHEQNVELERDLLTAHPRLDADGVSLEPGAHMIETKTDAFPAALQNCIVDQIELRRSVILYDCGRKNLVRSPYSSLPHVSPQQAMDNLVQRVDENPERGDRQITLMDVFRRRVQPAAHYPVYSVGEQYTHGVSDPDELLQTKRVLYALAPLIYNLFDNSPPFINGERQTVHPVIDLRLRLGRAGLIDAAAFHAADGEDYVERKILETMDKPLYVTHDETGRYVPVPDGKQVTFRELYEQGQGTKLLYLIAQLQGWPFLKDKLFHNEKDGFYAIGNEIRDLGNGPAAPCMAASLFTPIVFDREFREGLINLLETKYGFTLVSDPATAYDIVRANLHATHLRVPAEGKDPKVFLNAPFGDRGHSQLEFLNEDLIPMLTEKLRMTTLSSALEPLAFIARTGLTDTQFYHDTQPALQDTLDFMDPAKGYDHNVFQGARKPMAQLYAEGRLPQVNPENVRGLWGKLSYGRDIGVLRYRTDIRGLGV